MRTIIAPNENPSVVYQTCIDSIADEDLRQRLNALTQDIGAHAGDYQRRATAKKLYTIPSNDCGNDDIVLGAVTKKELKDVYSSHMVSKSKPARVIYDLLLSRAPLGKCPFCGVGQASTLDHYLPKAKYPQLSVVPFNLVPSCKDCNTGKSAGVATTEETQCLHPYFDGQSFEEDQWLFAEVVTTSPLSIRYFVMAPKHWDDISKKRVESHFSDFGLAKRYSIEAANELANQKYFLEDFKKNNGTDALVDLLSVKARSNSSVHVNSWQTAFYQALYGYYSISEVVDQGLHETCLVCEGEAVFVNYFCPLCNGNGVVSYQQGLDIDVTDYQYLECPECNGRARCRLCSGEGLIRREKALQLARNRP
jgi:5-methylcytosine-specific restriction endonuclease McrA